MMLFIFVMVCFQTSAGVFLKDGNLVKYSPIILIPGDGGNQIEAKIDRPFVLPGCSARKGWHRLWLDVWSLQGNRLRCWADTIRLVYNSTNQMSRNIYGVQTRVPGFGETSSVEYLDPSWSAWALADAGNYMKTMVDFFVSLGYERGVSVRAAPYDFRFAPHSQTDYFRRLTGLIEETSRKNENRRVTIISHSMGGLFGLHFLQRQSSEWRDRFIERFIPINTPWIGAAIQFNTYASGYNLGIQLIDPAIIREEQRSYETGVYILPNPNYWPNKNQIFVSTSARNYTIRDFPDFFQDIGFLQGMEMFENVVNITRMEHPGVKTTSIYSTGVNTPTGFIYRSGFPDKQPEKITTDGDGTVTLQSLAYADRFLTGSGDRSMVFHGVNHGAMLKEKNVFRFLQKQLRM